MTKKQEFLRIHKKEDWNGKKIFEGDILKWDTLPGAWN